MDNQRNILLAVALSGLLIFGWDMGVRHFYPETEATKQAQAAATAPSAQPGASSGAVAGVSGDLTGNAAQPTGPVDLKTALSSANRVAIDGPRIAGSINLVGARIDDIVLKDHRETISDDSGPVRLFAPQGTETQAFAQFGWAGTGVALPTAQTLWTADSTKLEQGSPVTLSHNNGAGQVFTVRFEVDENYLITATQNVQNAGEGAFVAQAFGLINRTSTNATPDEFIVHAGPIGVFDDAANFDWGYEDVEESKSIKPEGAPSWLGFTDRYWLSAIIPDAEQAATPSFRSEGSGIFLSDLIYDPVIVAAGSTQTHITKLFVGAKESSVLDQYAEAGISKFDLAIDWGWFRWFERPILWLLITLFSFVGNFGVAIILLTCIIRGLLFPIAQKQFSSMAGMKAVQPKMKAIQERFKEDKQKQQQEIMALYKKEGVNPLAGCLPLVIQIPIFFALYKCLILAIEMRHEPFFLWIKDLSAPDPAKILNLFGLLPFDPTGFLGIGILAVLLGVTMWLTFKLNPSAMDPMQQQIFNFMPWILMFVMAPFAAGLLLYWVTSNVLTLAQQSYLYSKHPQLRAASIKEKEDKAREKAREESTKE